MCGAGPPCASFLLAAREVLLLAHGAAPPRLAAVGRRHWGGGGGKKPRELHIPADEDHAKCSHLHLMALNRGMTPGLAGGVVLSLP